MSATPLPPSSRSSPSPARVREVLDLALERPSHERPAFIAGICGDDETLRAEVGSLLSALEAGGDLLEPPAVAASPEATPLTGLSFGNYKVGERIGEGGMGVVYRAEDTRLGRAVAVKALPPSLARDSHRRARFEHEARILASLSHPNIAAIHGVEETARGPVLVLEFVPGETLAKRLGEGRVPADEAITIAIGIARGLEAAHAAGVVHRDLKPSNVQLTPEGAVKILDFGVAKQVAAREGAEPGQTMAGQLIGTAGYMSPEQARGKLVDRRTDLWALGCVLYEMLAGARAFDGETSSDTVAAVLRAEPDWNRLPAGVSPSALRVLRRCLEKDPDRRQRDAGDVALELAAADSEPGVPIPRRSAWRGAAVAASVLAMGAIIGGVLVRGGGRTAPTSAPVRFQLTLSPEQAVWVTTGGAMAISPDGQTLVFAGGNAERSRLYSRRLDSNEIVELAGTDGAAEPCFSPDGRWIAFRSEMQLRRVSATGGGPEVLVTDGVSSRGLAWDEQGIVYFGGSPWGLWRVSPGAAPVSLSPSDLGPNDLQTQPEPLPGTDVVLYTKVVDQASGHVPHIEGVQTGSGERVVVVAEAVGARFLPPNRLLFWQAGALKSAPFDPAMLKLTDAPTVVMRPLAGGEFVQPPRFAVSRAGVLATLPGDIHYEHTQLAWFNPDGTWMTAMEGVAGIDAPRLSPDGKRVAMLMGLASGDVWVYNFERSTKLILTSGNNSHYPVWTPDGSRVVYASTPPDAPNRLQWIGADGSSPAETLWQAPAGTWVYATDFTADGRLLLSYDDEVPGGIDLFVFDMQTRETPRRLFPTTNHRFGARLSPDRTMIAYTSEETGKMEVYIHRFPSLESKISVSSKGGYRPVWSGDGRKLYFRFLDRVMVVDVGTGPSGEITTSPARMIAEHLPDARYDVDPSGQRLLMSRPPGEIGPQMRIDVVVGWTPEGR